MNIGIPSAFSLKRKRTKVSVERKQKPNRKAGEANAVYCTGGYYESKLMDLTDRGGDVADPWYSRRFDVAYRDILEGCTALLKAVITNEPSA